MNNATLINQDSGVVEYYTPFWIIAIVKEAMGGRISLDPASSFIANQIVDAEHYYTQADDGLEQDWIADRVWLNHPYSRQGNKDWINKAIYEYEAGHAQQLCMITWASTSEKWFKPLFHYPMCFIHGRVQFNDPNNIFKSGSTKGSVITYMGRNILDFYNHFKSIGSVMIPMEYRNWEIK